MIDPKLNTLLMVHEVNSFTRAAEKLSLTQPAVSQHIKQLETELGVKLFTRGERELRLTNEGKIVVQYARRIKVIYENMKRTLLDEKRGTMSLTVGITHTAESNQVAQVLAQYCSENDGVRIKIVSGAKESLYEKLKNYDLDLAIVEGKVCDNELNSVLLDTDSLVLVVSNNNALAKKSVVTIDEIKKEKMILRLPNSGTRNLFVSHLESNNISIDEFNVILEVDNTATIKDLVRLDMGVSILAKSVCRNELKLGQITALPVENLSMTREVNIVYNKDVEYIGILRDITKMYNETVGLYRI